MCWSEKTTDTCPVCRKLNSKTTIWLGCHLSKTEESPCTNPTISLVTKTTHCIICQHNLDDQNDVHPDFPPHPGFPLPKPEVKVSFVPLPPPTDYKTPLYMQNEPAGNLPSYEQSMAETPMPPTWQLSEIRQEHVIGLASDLSFKYWQILLSQAKTQRSRITTLISRANRTGDAVEKLEWLAEYIETLLQESEKRIQRCLTLERLIKTTLSVDVNMPLQNQNQLSEYTVDPSTASLQISNVRAAERELEDLLERYATEYPDAIAFPQTWERRVNVFLDDVEKEIEREVQVSGVPRRRMPKRRNAMHEDDNVL